MMIKTLDKTVSTMQKPGQRSLIVSDNSDFLFDPQGQHVIRANSKESLMGLLSELEKAEHRKNASFKLNERGIECVVVDQSIKTRRFQKLYQLQKLRQQRRVLRVAVIEQTENLQNINGTHDNDVDCIVINLMHEDFADQVKRVKQRFCKAQHTDMHHKIDSCLAETVYGKNGWFVICFVESYCCVEYFQELATSVDAELLIMEEINHALDLACQDTFTVDELTFGDEEGIIASEEGYICSACNGQTEQDDDDDYSYSYSDDEEETVTETKDNNCEEIRDEESVSDSDDEESASDSEESVSDSDDEESASGSGDEESASDSDDEESASESDDDESNAQSDDEESKAPSDDEESKEDASDKEDEVVVVNQVYTAPPTIEKSEDDIAYEMAMEKIDSLIEQLQKTRAAAKLAKESKQSGWLSWLWVASK